MAGGGIAAGARPAAGATIESERIKIYSDRTFVSPATGVHCAMMVPFWGAGEVTDWYSDNDLFDDYRANGGAYFELVDRISECDLAILPSTLHRYVTDGTQRLACQFAEKAAAAGKPVVVFHERDYDFKLPFANGFLFSPTIEGPAGPQEFALPGWVPDHLPGGARPRTWMPRPVVGFCGWVRRPDLRGRLTNVLRMFVPPFDRKQAGPFRASLTEVYRHRYLRGEMVDILRCSREIETNFVLRDRFLNGFLEAGAAGNVQRREQIRDRAFAEFVENMEQSTYVLCVRGIGNYSLRFYETLAMGRIPLFINTNCVLPYSDFIDWGARMPWVEWQDRDHAGRRLLAYHGSLAAGELEDRQRDLRALWEEWLSPDGFFRNFHRHFRPAGMQPNRG